MIKHPSPNPFCASCQVLSGEIEVAFRTRDAAQKRAMELLEQTRQQAERIAEMGDKIDTLESYIHGVGRALATPPGVTGGKKCLRE